MQKAGVRIARENRRHDAVPPRGGLAGSASSSLDASPRQGGNCGHACAPLARVFHVVADPVRAFEDAADEDAYVAYAHRNPWLRVGTLVTIWSGWTALYSSRRGRVWQADEAMPITYVALVSLLSVTTAIMVSTMPVVTRRVAVALGPARVAALPSVAQRVIATDGALAFEAALVALIVLTKVIELCIGSEPLRTTDAGGELHTAVAVQTVMNAWYRCAASPPRFWPLGPFMAAFLPVMTATVFAAYAPSLSGGHLGAAAAAVTWGAAVLACVAALWAWDSQRRRAFVALRRNAARSEATRNVVSALASLADEPATAAAPPSQSPMMMLHASTSDACVVSATKSSSLSSGCNFAEASCFTGAVVVLQPVSFAGAVPTLYERHRSLCALVDALAAASLLTETRVKTSAIIDGRLIAIVATSRVASTPDSEASADGFDAPCTIMTATESKRPETAEQRAARRAAFLAHAVMRLATDQCGHSSVNSDVPLGTPRTPSKRRPAENGISSSSVIIDDSQELHRRRSGQRIEADSDEGQPLAAGASMMAGDAAVLEFSAAITLGAVEVAPAPEGAPAGAAAVSGDAVLRALDVASLCSPPGQTVLSDEVRVALAGDFATAYVRSYLPRATTADDGAPRERVNVHVRGVAWSRAAQELEQSHRSQLCEAMKKTAAEMSSSDSARRPPSSGSTLTASPSVMASTSTTSAAVATVDPGCSSPTDVEILPPAAIIASAGALVEPADAAPAAEPPAFGFRFPWGLQFDDPDVEHDFRRVEHAGAGRLPVAVYAAAFLIVLPALDYADGSAPDGLGYFLWGLRSALGVVHVGLSCLERPGPRVLVAQTVLVGLLGSGLTVPWFRHMHREPTVPLLYDSQTQYIFDLIAALLVTPSALPWWAAYFLSVAANIDQAATKPAEVAMPPQLLLLAFVMMILGLTFAVYAVRLRQRHAFAALVASERAVEAWAVRRRQLERELELLTWPCVARDACDAAATGRSAEPREYATWRAALVPEKRHAVTASQLRDVALAVYSHPEARALGLAVEARADSVIVIADAASVTEARTVWDALLGIGCHGKSGFVVRPLSAGTAVAGCVHGRLSDRQFFVAAHDAADDSSSTTAALHSSGSGTWPSE